MISPFLLEDIYNASEGSYETTISSGTFPALSLVDLLAFYDEETRLQVLESWLSLRLDYSEQYGLEMLRKVIARSVATKQSISHDDLLITSGASEAIYIVFKTLCEKYSAPTFIVQKPIYQSLYQVAADSGARIIDWNYDTALSAEENIANLPFDESITGLVLCNPNNPMGTVIPNQGLQLIRARLQERRALGDPALLIVDEVFRESSLVPVVSAINYDPEAIVISDLSKSYSLPGLRIGYIASQNREFLAACSALKNYLSLRSSTLCELIACSALEHADFIINRNREIAATNLETLRASDIELDIHPDYIGGPVLFPRYSSLRGAQRGAILSSSLTLTTGSAKDPPGLDLFIIHGNLFGDYPDRIRIGLGSWPRDFKQALAALEYKLCPKPPQAMKL